MKRSTGNCLSAFCLVSLGYGAFMDDADRKVGEWTAQEMVQRIGKTEVMKRYDSNRDGKLSRREGLALSHDVYRPGDEFRLKDWLSTKTKYDYGTVLRVD